MNWLDYLLAGLLIAFVAQGLIRGFARVAVGLAATVLGLLAAAWFYGVAAALFAPYVKSQSLANFLGFLTIFVTVQLVGALISWLMGKFFKGAGLDWLNRLLGGAFGVVKAAVIGVVLVLALTAFPVKPVPDSVARSRLSPYFIEASHVLVYLTPRELKDGFIETYERIKKLWSEPGKSPRGVPRDSA